LSDQTISMLEKMIGQQEARVLDMARRLKPGLTADDLKNPHDFPELALDARFAFEDGQTAGLRAAQAAIRAIQADQRER